MSLPDQSESELHRAESLAGTPAVHRAECWWLTTSSGAVPADAKLARTLDRHAADLAAADRAVADTVGAA